MITIYTMAYNEEIIIKSTIEHYRSRFPDCHMVVYDNFSTDNTVSILKENNCEVITFDTNGEVDDFKLRDLKNNCWKNAKTDWVLICDPDEFLDITEQQLKNEEMLSSTIICSEAYNMINMEDNYDIANIKYGIRDPNYDKYYLFNKKFIKEINYECGAHKANPIGIVNKSVASYKLYHNRFIHPDLTIIKYKSTVDRLNKRNKDAGFGSYCYDSPENIKREFGDRRAIAEKVIP